MRAFSGTIAPASIADRQGPARRPHERPGMARLCLCLVLALGVLYPRLALLGGYPGMDEGSYGFISALFARGFAQKHAYGFSFYPLVLSWVYELPGMPMLWFRLCDLLWALIAGWLLCRILQRESGRPLIGLWLALAVLCPLNSAHVIDSGFKNSMAPALAFFFWAICLARDESPAASPRWLAIGLLTAAAILFRESFIFFALLGLLAIWAGWGWAAAWRYALGGIAAALVFCLLMQIACQDSGGIAPFLKGYADRAALYANESSRICYNFVRRGLLSLEVFSGAVLACALSFGLFFPFRREVRPWRKKFLFWLGAIFIALIEPLSKLGFVYHFSICYPALAACAALAWRAIPPARGAGLFGRGLMIASLVLALLALPAPSRFQQTLALARNFPSVQWPEDRVEKSMPLRVAREIMAGGDKGASLAASGFSFFLYYITGLMPPARGAFDPDDIYRLSDLSRTFFLLHKDVHRLAEAIRGARPEIIAVGVAGSTHEQDFNAEIVRAIDLTGLYEPAREFPWDMNLDYGWMGYKLYRLRQPAAGQNPQQDARDTK